MNIAVISPDFKFSEAGIKKIQAAIPSFLIAHEETFQNDEVTAVIVDDSPNRQLNRFPNLKVIFSVSAGVDNLLEESSLLDIPIIKVVSQDMLSLMREYVTYQVIRLHRGFKQLEQLQKNSEWQWFPPSNTPSDCTVTILGLGQLGLVSAKALHHLGFNVIGWSKSEKQIDGICCEHELNGLNKTISKTDILVCLLPLTSETKGILNHSLFDKMPKGSSVINVSRGGCLNQTDLLNALNKGQLSFAVLDVFTTEPLPIDSELWQHAQISITPHIAAYPHPDSFIDDLILSIKNNEVGEQARRIVNKKNGY